ncbi:MAG: polysaccharide biosynthesis tyrosine autokinase [Methylovirgula sp.]
MNFVRGFDFNEPEPRQPGLPAPASNENRQMESGSHNALAPASPYNSFYDEPQSSFDLLKYWGLLLKHRWLFLAAAVIGLAYGYGSTYLATPIYRASATIQIDREVPKPVDLRGEDTDTDSAIVGDEEFYQTEYQLLKSRSLAERVVADLDLANEPTFLGSDTVSPSTKLRELIFGTPANHADDEQPSEVRKEIAIGRVQGGSSVVPVPDSALVGLSFDDPNQTWAKKIVDALSQAFIKSNLEHRYNATAYARNFLQDQLAKTKLKLEQSERDLVGYAKKEQIVNLDDKQVSLDAAGLLAINAELARVRTERITNQQLWQQAESTDGLGLPQIIADPSIQMLRDKRAILKTEYQDKLSTFKPSFPDMRQLQAQINEVDRQIENAVAIIKNSIKAKYEASQQQENLLVAQLGRSKNQVLNVEDRNIEYTILKRETDTNRALYDALLQRYKAVGVDSGIGINNISVVDAGQPQGMVSPSLRKNLGFSLAFSLIGAFAAAYILELLDDTFKTPEQVEESLRVPVVGLAPLVPKDRPVAEALRDPHSALSEAFRSLRTALQFSTNDGVPKSLLVTSSCAGEGKSSTSLALARNFAQLSLNVLLVDADLRKPTLHEALGCHNSSGLSNYLVGNFDRKLFQETSTLGLTFMASGPLPPNPAELLAGPKLLTLLTFAAQEFDLVILDGPPVVAIADALLLGSLAIGTLFVVRACGTSKKVVRRAMNRLYFARARVIGVVLNCFDARKAGFEYGYGYSHDYYQSYGNNKSELPPNSERPALTIGE